jgi:hypothetical protein
VATDVNRCRCRDGKGGQARTCLARATVVQAERTGWDGLPGGWGHNCLVSKVRRIQLALLAVLAMVAAGSIGCPFSITADGHEPDGTPRLAERPLAGAFLARRPADIPYCNTARSPWPSGTSLGTGA